MLEVEAVDRAERLERTLADLDRELAISVLDEHADVGALSDILRGVADLEFVDASAPVVVTAGRVGRNVASSCPPTDASATAPKDEP